DPEPGASVERARATADLEEERLALDRAQRAAAGDALSDRDVDARDTAVDREEAAAVVDDDHAAIARVTIAERDASRRRGEHGRPARAVELEPAAVLARRLADRAGRGD